MTAGIALLVMLPVAISPKTGLDAYRPLAIAVVGGLVSGTILSLFDIPIMHTYVDDFVRWLNRTFLNREWNWPVTDPDDPLPPDSPSVVEALDAPEPVLRP